MRQAILLGLILLNVTIGGAAWSQRAMVHCISEDGGPYVPAQPGAPCPMVLTPSGAAWAGVTPVSTVAAASSLLIKDSPGNLYGVYATNPTVTDGFLLVFDRTTVPADGAVTPLGCVPIAGGTTASIRYGDGPPARYATGIVAVLSSGVNCHTKTTGVITGFISGAAK